MQGITTFYFYVNYSHIAATGYKFMYVGLPCLATQHSLSDAGPCHDTICPAPIEAYGPQSKG